jgi:hypothetical protein
MLFTRISSSAFSQENARVTSCVTGSAGSKPLKSRNCYGVTP